MSKVSLCICSMCLATVSPVFSVLGAMNGHVIAGFVWSLGLLFIAAGILFYIWWQEKAQEYLERARSGVDGYDL